MKVRMGYITNSSSTNFLIISKEELQVDFLFKKLGFKDNMPMADIGYELCESIVRNANMQLRYEDYTVPDYDNIKKVFGPKASMEFERRKGAYTYWGYTSTDEGGLEAILTTDSFEINEKDIYINARSCVW